MMHLLLFMAVRPSKGNGLGGMLVAPETRYLTQASSTLPLAGSGVRTTWSPVLFSLPSKMGFSRDLLEEQLQTPTTHSPKVELESFLELDPVSRNTDAQIIPKELMLTAGGGKAPQLPVDTFTSPAKGFSSRRVYMVPGLQERLLGGVVLPPELNKPAATPWEVRADVSISKQGTVRHVFLEHPLESTRLNRDVIQLLYGLHFKSGDGPIEGSIEIYSSEATVDGDMVK
jgi:hypothetical protein